VEAGLCFGRLDFDRGEPRYVGLLGILDENDEYRSLLVDWRAPAARPFYLATAASPDGVRRRRHLRTRLRKVVALDDEVLDLTAADHTGRGDREITGEAALLAALDTARTGRMSEIVRTIQAEQDRIIRAEATGVLVVQGGPGTGKTAVALHRAAFLLYTHRERLARAGVLVLGPNPTFLSYISHVLPSLGETGVWSTTLGELFPGVRADRTEPAGTAEIKGSLTMIDVVLRAVAARQHVPDEPMEILFDRERLTLDPATCERARARGRACGKPHNIARPLVVSEIVEVLTWQVADGLGREFLDPGDISDIRRELLEAPEVRGALDRLWPELTPTELLEDLFADPDRIAEAAPELTEDERRGLRRDPGGWTPEDVPLLYEAVEALGIDDREARSRERRRQAERLAYAEGVLDILRLADDELDPDVLMATDLIDAGRLAGRQDDEVELTTAERAAADHTWTFGHVIVDEAQELSPMAWRVVMFRCPSRSMTVVGDTGQTGDLAGTDSWSAALAPYVADRWRLERLTVNYRTPAEIMAMADRFAPDGEVSTSVRSTGVVPTRHRYAPEELAPRLADLMAAETATHTEGRIGVIVPTGRLTELTEAVLGSATHTGPDLDNRVAVLTVKQSKGLEFDTVLVVEPTEILAESRRGRRDLYVALTRATHRLRLVHTVDLPPELSAPPD
jgi:DNA helicase IV